MARLPRGPQREPDSQIVATAVDPATERIVRFLNEGFTVPVNVVFFRHFEDGGASYLARSWLVNQEAQAVAASAAKARKSREPWNGHDWYVSFGDESGRRAWADAVKFGFISAGGGEWFSRTLKNLPIGARVFACIPERGYVGVGTVLGEAQKFDEALLSVDGTAVPMSDLRRVGNYRHNPAGDTDETAEYVVPANGR